MSDSSLLCCKHVCQSFLCSVVNIYVGYLFALLPVCQLFVLYCVPCVWCLCTLSHTLTEALSFYCLLKHTIMHCGTSRQTLVCYSETPNPKQSSSTLQHTATHYKHTATHCNTLQHRRCNILQHTAAAHHSILQYIKRNKLLSVCVCVRERDGEKVCVCL